MESLIWFCLVFIIVYLVYFLFVICRKKKLEKVKQSTEMLFLKKRFKLNLEKINVKFLAHFIALINAFIIAVTFVVVELFDNIIIKLMVAFVVLIILILLIYSLFGKILKKKEGKINV